jgi:hypothetical protein
VHTRNGFIHSDFVPATTTVTEHAFHLASRRKGAGMAVPNVVLVLSGKW